MTKRVVLAFMLMLGSCLPLWAQEAPRRFYAPASQPGLFRLLEPPLNKPVYELPEPGLGNACDEGALRSMFVSPNGQFVVGEVVSRDAISLCLYDLTQLRDTPTAGMLVRVARVTLSGLVEVKGASSTRAGTQRSADLQPTWASSSGSHYCRS
ncbi:MAG: hypothetical protein ACKO6N_08495 [Myxococcota bacterium]